MTEQADRWLARREGWNPQSEDARGAGNIDYSRVVHSASFRRLQGKTQILNLGDSDFYRTRLTHSLEVAQIASGIARQLEKSFPDHPAVAWLPDAALSQAIGLTHDLGHPPFGHGGEVALNYCMRDCGGFEGNGQTLRVLARLEKFSREAGSNLTRRSLLGVLKYPASYSATANPERRPSLRGEPTVLRIIDRKASKPPKCYLDCEADVVGWILEPLSPGDRDAFEAVRGVPQEHARTLHKSFDCSIMDLADDIGFGVHDFEDALAMELMREAEFRSVVTEEASASFLDHLKTKYPAEFGNNVYDAMVAALFADDDRRKRFIGRMVGHLINSLTIETDEAFGEPLLRYRAAMKPGPRRFLDALQEAVRTFVIFSAGVQHLEFKGQTMVVAVFEALSSEPHRFLPAATRALYDASATPERVLCDHIAGMTDGFLLKTYDRLFSPRMGSIFDRL
jgi:dGTPase